MDTPATVPDSTAEATSSLDNSTALIAEIPSSPDKSTAPPPMPSGPKTRYDWYQTGTHVVISIMIKNVKKEDFKINIQEKTLSATVAMPTSSEYSLELDLAHPVVPGQSQARIMSTKIEVRLKKAEGIQWTKLEGDGELSNVKQFTPTDTGDETHKYPSSAHCTRDWDKVVSDIKKDEENEKPEGDAALNQLFEKIYGDGSDDVKKAMAKSFQESGGTVLSTNWNEIGSKKTEIKPPDGMEWKPQY